MKALTAIQECEQFFIELAWYASVHGYNGPSYAEAFKAVSTKEDL